MAKNIKKPQYTIDELPMDKQKVAIDRFRKKVFWKYKTEITEKLRKKVLLQITSNPLLKPFTVFRLECGMDSEIGRGLQFEGFMLF